MKTRDFAKVIRQWMRGDPALRESTHLARIERLEEEVKRLQADHDYRIRAKQTMQEEIAELEISNEEKDSRIAALEEERDEANASHEIASTALATAKSYLDEITVRCNLTPRDTPSMIDELADRLASAEGAVERLREAAQQAIDHVTELSDAWMTGAISEHDGKGGLRSNRNVDVQTKLRAALLATQPEEGSDAE